MIVNTIKLKCSNCGKDFEKTKKEYNRRLKLGKTIFFCNVLCSHKKTITETKESKCVTCGNVFAHPSKDDRVCCSNKCSATFVSQKTRQKRSDILRAKLGKAPIDLNLRAREKNLCKKIKYPKIRKPRTPKEKKFKKCEICSAEFFTRLLKTRTCGKICYNKLQRIQSTANPNCGGETNYRKYSYKGISMDSSWEVELAGFLDKNNILWIRDRKLCFLYIDEEGCKRRYYPDFYLPEYEIYLDPKNKYLQEKDKSKIDKVRSQHDITLLTGFLNKIKEQIINLKKFGEAPNYCI